MSELPGSHSRVVFEVPTEHLPELMSMVGQFALDHSIVIEVGPSDAEAPSLQVETEPRPYNPDLVFNFYPHSPDEPVPAVPHNALTALERKMKDGATHDATRLMGVLYHASKNGLTDFLIFNDRGNVIGIRADKIHDLVALIKSGVVKISGLGDKSIELLEATCNALYLEER